MKVDIAPPKDSSAIARRIVNENGFVVIELGVKRYGMADVQLIADPDEASRIHQALGEAIEAARKARSRSPKKAAAAAVTTAKTTKAVVLTSVKAKKGPK